MNAYISQIEEAITEAAGNQGAQKLEASFGYSSDDFVAATGRKGAIERVTAIFDKRCPTIENVEAIYDAQQDLQAFYDRPWLPKMQ